MKKLYTLGYGGRHPKDLIALLKDNGIRAVADVRLRPDKASMGSYVKAKSAEKGIQALLSSDLIEYFSLVELGNVFADREDWAQRYAELLARAGDLLTERLVHLPQPFCLLCAEKRVHECHRKQIADYLAKQGWAVEHLE